MFSTAATRRLALSTISASVFLSFSLHSAAEPEGKNSANGGSKNASSSSKRRPHQDRLQAALTNVSAFTLRSRLNKVDLDSVNDIEDEDEENHNNSVDGGGDDDNVDGIVKDNEHGVVKKDEKSTSSSYLARQFLHVAASRSGSNIGAPVILAAQIKDVSTIGHEVALVASSRGCSEDEADSVKRAIEAAALADKHGLSYYLVTDETPESVLTYLRQSLFFDGFSSSTSSSNKQGEKGQDSAKTNSSPKYVVFDRAASTRRKYIMDAKASVDADVAGALHPPPSPPYPSDVADYVNRVVSGEFHPTLVGKPRPDGDHVPLHPSLTQVVGSSFQDLVLDPKYDVCLEAYLSNCPMCMCLAPRIRMLALLAHNHFPHVKVAVMNVDENDRPMEWMPGPAFPTLQLFNGISSSSSLSSSSPSPHVFDKEMGPKEGCSKEIAAFIANKARSFNSSSSSDSSIARTTFIGSSCPCVPAVDFSHPSAPGKMALPSVVELLNWVAANNRKPFHPASISVDKSSILNSLSTFRDFVPPSSVDPTEQSSSSTLLTLARDMDAEAKVFEVAVFDLFYYEHMANTASKGKSRTNDQNKNLATFKIECIDRLRRAATDGATYGTAHEAYSAMNTCADLGEELGIRDLAKAVSISLEEQKNEDKAKEILNKLQKK
jgi:hypothetical protein